LEGSIILVDHKEHVGDIDDYYVMSHKASEKYTNELVTTKANTLILLKEHLVKSKIEDIVVITVDEYFQKGTSLIEKISEEFKNKKIIIRSSSSNEDSYDKSNAGHYDSVLNVNSASNIEIKSAIELVIRSYRKDSLFSLSEQILIQPQTENILLSGVVFTRDIHQNRPYYVINYDENGKTDAVTSGFSNKTIWISHDSNEIPMQWKSLIDSIREIENYLNRAILDIEFGITKAGEIVIFQVRPLAAIYKMNKEINDTAFLNTKNIAKSKYNSIVNDFENRHMTLSDMAFWNPSEIIGSNPRNLDYSLYKEIITNRAWNEGLVPMGYQKVNKDLMYKIGNKPYISLEYSFMSLIPSNIDKKLAIKLIKFYRDKLKCNLSAHDKIEFEIVLSCFDFETDERLLELTKYKFQEEDIKKNPP
jgi:hypothetical protein